jgi:hypothetical protein
MGSASKVIVLGPLAGREVAEDVAEAMALEVGGATGSVEPAAAGGVVDVREADVDTERSQLSRHATAQMNAALARFFIA